MASTFPKSLRVPARTLAIVLTLAVVAAFSARAHAQQTTVAVSLYGAYNGRTSGNGTIQSPSNQAGGLFELRYIANPLVGFELNYSYNRANQSYSIPTSLNSVKANANEFGADWVVSFPFLSLRPFALAGAGLIDFKPVNGQQGVSSKARPVFVYGAGLDWGILPHFGLRAQYRGNLYHAPDLLKVARSTDSFTRTAEPMIGAYFKF